MNGLPMRLARAQRTASVTYLLLLLHSLDVAGALTPRGAAFIWRRMKRPVAAKAIVERRRRRRDTARARLRA